MKMQQLVVRPGKTVPYAGKRYAEGQTFFASPRDARILIALGKCQEDLAPPNVEPADAAQDSDVLELVHRVMDIPKKRGRGRPRKEATI